MNAVKGVLFKPNNGAPSMKSFLFAAFALSLVMSGFAHAQPATCHALAASPSDPARKGPGVSYAKLEGARAEAACKVAVAAAPKDGQLWFQYGRALEKVNNVNAAIEAYRKGSDLDNPGALNNLGELYRDGKGVTRNPYLAEVLFQNAAVQNFPEAAQNLKGLERIRPPVSARTIPTNLRGKFSVPGQTCQQTREMSQAFGGNFMGLEVNALEVIQPSEMMCTTMNVTVENPQQASAVLKCSKNSPEVSLVQATIRPDGVRLMRQGVGDSLAVRCPT
jgi:TPR repeat protein